MPCKPLRLKLTQLEDRLAPAIVTQMLMDIYTDTIDGVPTFPVGSSTSPYVWKEFSGEVYFPGNDRTPGCDNYSTELWKTDGTTEGRQSGRAAS